MSESAENLGKIKVELLDPAGKKVSFNVPSMAPPELFIKEMLFPLGTMWNIDYTTIPQGLVKDWILADVEFTVRKYLEKNLPVKANGTLYTSVDQATIDQTVQEIEEDIKELVDQAAHRVVITKLPQQLVIGAQLDMD